MPPRGSAPDSSKGLLSIGALSAATGIPIDTIRTWERRYGFPVPVRKPSGHRVYPLSLVPRLRRAAQAIARGHRAAEVVPASERALDALLDSLPQMPVGRVVVPAVPGQTAQDGDELLGLVRTFDTEGLRRRIETDWARLGPMGFLEGQIAPFLTSVGEAWEQGRLDVRHEHFATGVLGDFLRAVRLPLSDRATGPIAALATLPGELHGLGLQMVALVCSLAGWRPLVLGIDTPIPQIISLAREAPLGVVALSSVQPRPRSAAMIQTLRRGLPRRVPLLVGGRGAHRLPKLKGVEIISDLTGLEGWLRAYRGTAPSVELALS
jgi:MerR family transcriptional regulator, light-induced transcriptional regulator